MHDFRGFMTEPIKGMKKEIVSLAKKGWGRGEDIIPDKLTEDDLMEMSASEPVPDNEEEDVEEAVPENKSTLANLAEGFGLFKTGFDLYLFIWLHQAFIAACGLSLVGVSGGYP